MRTTSRNILFSKELGWIALVFSPLVASSAWSQQPVTALEEVLVTALMREGQAQSAPLAIGVYDKQFIQQQGASSLTHLEKAIPSLNFGSGDRGSRGEIAIRGVGDYARNIGTNARVAVYVDGVLVGRSRSFDQSLLDAVRVEVLRGPQGTLAGTNALAGAINIVTQQPDNTTKASLFTNTGNYDLLSATGTVNLPVTENLYASLLVSSTEQGGYIRNITRDSDLQGVSRETAKLKLRYVGIERLTLDVGFDYLNDDRDATNAEALGVIGPFNGFKLAPDPYVVAHNADEFEQRELKGVTINAVYDTPENFQWVSITGVRSNDFSERSDEDYSPLDIAISEVDEQSDQISQELRLVSPKNDDFDYIAGVYLLDQDITTDRRAVTGVMSRPANTSTHTPATAEVESASVYFHGDYYFDTHWSLTAGVRYVSETKDIDYSSIDSTGLSINVNHLRDQQTFNEWLPKFGINFQLSPAVLFYSSVARGYKSGGWNADFISTLENFQFDPEYAVNYEIGAKSSFLDQKLTLNVSAFETRFDDFQVFQFVRAREGAGTILSLTNAGEVTSNGVELEFNALLTERLSFSASASFTNARFDEFKNGGKAGVNYDDHYLPYAPKNNYFFALDYSRPLWNGAEAYAHIDYSYTDDYFSNPDNAPVNFIPHRDNVDTRLGLKLGSTWDLSLWVKNLTDEASLRQRSVSFLEVPRGVYVPPRTYGLSINYSFN